MNGPVLPYGEMPLTKKEQVALMFDRIAFRYDLMNRLLSFGIDVYWRKVLVKTLARSQPGQILDVATGTADVALVLAEQLETGQITGVDISEEMLALGRKKVESRNFTRRVHLQYADCDQLPFDNNKFDAVTVAFGVRNFENLGQGLSEIRRVLKPGGQLHILEFSKPKRFPFTILYQFYFSTICPIIGRIITRDRQAYQYLHRSVMAFPEGNQFTEILRKTGFDQTQCRPLSFGISSIYTATKS